MQRSIYHWALNADEAFVTAIGPSMVLIESVYGCAFTLEATEDGDELRVNGVNILPSATVADVEKLTSIADQVLSGMPVMGYRARVQVTSQH